MQSRGVPAEWKRNGCGHGSGSTGKGQAHRGTVAQKHRSTEAQRHREVAAGMTSIRRSAFDVLDGGGCLAANQKRGALPHKNGSTAVL